MQIKHTALKAMNYIHMYNVQVTEQFQQHGLSNSLI